MSASTAGTTAKGRRLRVVVIGGGLSGTVFAIHLLRDHPALRLELTIVEPRARLGAGLAYSATDPQHRINVAAARMVLFAEDDRHFERWLRARDAAAADPACCLPDGRLYPRRAVFGTYLAETLAETVDAAAHRVQFRHLNDLAVAARPDGAGFTIDTAKGEQIEADLLVLATGHPPPVTPPFLQDLPAGRLVLDPWARDALDRVKPEDAVVIVGTGLTGADMIASLGARTHRGPITAVSRHGLLPRPRTLLPVQAYGDFATSPARSALDLLRRVRRAVAICREAGRPWEDVVDALRRDAGVLWPALPPQERRTLLRHLRAFWDVHRFQSAPQIDAVVADMLRRGQLTVLGGRVEAVQMVPGADPETGEEKRGERMELLLRPRGANAGRRRVVAADIIINCTGPGHRDVVQSNPVLRSLADTGIIRSDPLGLGLDVDAESQPAGPASRIFVLGPLARSAHGELMGLPQVSLQPRRVAASVARILGSG